MDLAEPEGLGLTAQVVAILEATIGLDNVEMTDTFAELGIDSLGWLRLYRGLKSCPLVKSVRSELLADGETTVHTLELEFTNWEGDLQTIKIKYLTCFGPKLDCGDAVAIDFLDKVTYVQPGMIIIEGFNNPSTA